MGFVAVEEAILRHKMLIRQNLSTYKTTMSSVNAAEWLKAIDTEVDKLQQLKTWEAVKISSYGLSYI